MFDGYILVGGKSSRMKTGKFALSLGGFTFAERALFALRKIADRRVFFVVGANQTKDTTELLPPDIPQITDVYPNKAAIGGIYTALAHSASEWTAILACDYPFVTGELFVRLTEAADSVDDDVAAIVPVQPDGRIQPLCAVYRTEFCLKAATILMESDEIPPARRLAENVKTGFVQFNELADLRRAEFFFTNVNTPEEYLEAQNIFRRVTDEQR
ncbi:MAG: molybdenum cofactor guanylyltransferase [Acidobacteriota bacterium]|nr:molybdenum cofactor guanylyltransferase [Acidobacteriota bacterium]